MSAEQVVAWGTAFLVIATLGLVGVTLHGIRAQLWLMTFSEYTRRYSDIVKSLPPDARRPGPAVELGKLPVELRDGLLTAMRSYFNLCSEELFLHIQRRIDETTWKIWETGMRDTSTLPYFRAAWAELRGEYQFYPEFQRFVDQLSG